MKISREDVIRVAELAHLELSPEEIDLYRGQLDEILTYIGKLEELDVTSVEPMAQVLLKQEGDAHPELRDDVLSPCDVAPAILAQAAGRRPTLLPRPQGDRPVKRQSDRAQVSAFVAPGSAGMPMEGPDERRGTLDYCQRPRRAPGTQNLRPRAGLRFLRPHRQTQPRAERVPHPEPRTGLRASRPRGRRRRQG